jgi:hypothetical protein
VITDRRFGARRRRAGGRASTAAHRIRRRGAVRRTHRRASVGLLPYRAGFRSPRGESAPSEGDRVVRRVFGKTPHAPGATGDGEPLHRAMLSVDIEASSGRGDAAQRLIRAALWDALSEAVRQSGIDPAACVRSDYGDGFRLIFPPGTRKSRLIYPLISDLAARLKAHNAKAAALTAIRIRAALHAGDVSLDREGQPEGAALEVQARLIEAPLLHTALRQAPQDVPVALLLSSHFHGEAVQQGIPGIEPAAYREVAFTTKEYSGMAWLYLPGYTLPDQVAQPAEPDGADQTAPPKSGRKKAASSKMTNRVSGHGVGFFVQNGDQYVDYDRET